jgi:hypothetical protein
MSSTIDVVKSASSCTSIETQILQDDQRLAVSIVARLAGWFGMLSIIKRANSSLVASLADKVLMHFPCRRTVLRSA